MRKIFKPIDASLGLHAGLAQRFTLYFRFYQGDDHETYADLQKLLVAKVARAEVFNRCYLERQGVAVIQATADSGS